MKRVSMIGLAALFSLALLSAQASNGDDKTTTDKKASDKKAAASKAAMDKKLPPPVDEATLRAAEQIRKAQGIKLDKTADETTVPKATTEKSAADSKTANKAATGKHMVNKPVAQDMKAAKAQASKPRLPSGWGKIGLTEEQHQKVYAVASKYSAQIKNLEAQLQALRHKQNEEMTALLTDKQKTALADAKAASKKKTPAQSGAVSAGEDKSASAASDKSEPAPKAKKKRNRRQKDNG